MGAGRQTSAVPESKAAPEAESSAWLRWGLIFYAAMVVVALVWRWGFVGEPVWFVSRAAAEQGAAPARDILLGLVVGGGVVAVSQGLTSRTEWGERLARAIVKRQREDGAWVNHVPRWYEGNPTISTSYALIALQECLGQD